MREMRKQDKTIIRAGVRFVKLLDVILVAIPFALCWYLYYTERTFSPYYYWGNILVMALFLIIYYFIAHLYGGFPIHIKRISELMYSQSVAVVVTDCLMYIIIWLLTKFLPNVIPLLLCLVGQFLCIALWCTLAHKWYFRHFPARNSLIIWDTREGVGQLLQEYGLDQHFKIEKAVPVNECLADLYACLQNVEVVFLSGIHSHDRNKIAKYCIEHDIIMYIIPRVGDVLMSGAMPLHLLHLPMLMLERYNPTPEYLFFKRVMDIVLSAVALIIASPVMLIVAVIIKATDGGTVFYRQCRLTRNGKEFNVLKFRSMRMDAEKDGVARLSTGEQDPRITPIGRFIRKVRIDELPQLINILKGEMSIVGPRPERPEIARQYEEELPEFSLRHQAKAGLTGYAQVYGKYNTTPYDKLLMDLMYIAKPSLAEDLKIIFATVQILFMPESTEGVSEGQTTASTLTNNVSSHLNGEPVEESEPEALVNEEDKK